MRKTQDDGGARRKTRQQETGGRRHQGNKTPRKGNRGRAQDTNAHTEIQERNPHARRMARKQAPVGKHLAPRPRRVKTTKGLEEAADEGETTERRRCDRHARYEDTEHNRVKKRAQATEASGGRKEEEKIAVSPPCGSERHTYAEGRRMVKRRSEEGRSFAARVGALARRNDAAHAPVRQ
jgi:hypothetical protein